MIAKKIALSVPLKMIFLLLLLCALFLTDVVARSQPVYAQARHSQMALNWSGWRVLPGEGTTDAPVAALDGPSGFPTWLFSKGIDDHQVYFNLSPSSQAQLLPGNMQTSVALNAIRYAVSGRDTVPFLFANNMNDHRIYYNLYEGHWLGWQEVPGGGTTDAALASAIINNRLYLFAKGIDDDGIYMNVANGSSWSGWSAVPGNGHTNAALSVTLYGSGLHLFAKGIDDDGIYENDFNGANWTGWFAHQSGGHTDRALASIAHNGSLYLFSKGVNDNGIYVDRMSNGAWQGWQAIGGTTNVSLAAAEHCGNLELYGKGINDNRVYQNILSDNSGIRCTQS